MSVHMEEQVVPSDAGDTAGVAHAAGGTQPVQVWLYTIAALIALMVVVGGATRLTDSGLSITEWQLVMGAIPPLTEADWLGAFEKYKQIPEYKNINRGMSLEEFKFIYWWEWGHRFLGRIIGFVFLLPLLWFWFTGRLGRSIGAKLAVLFVIGGAQGFLGWYMVQSGLAERVDVSQYRLAAHLGLAVLLFAATLWIAFDLRVWRPEGEPAGSWASNGAAALCVLIFLQIILGAFVAGLDAGMGYNTWPTMNGEYIPEGLMIMEPAWKNLFENAMTVQFNHRMLAYVIALVAIAYAFQTFRRRGKGVLSASSALIGFVVLVQIGLGIATVVWQVPIDVALTHQVGALVLLALALHHLHVLVSRNRERERGRQAPTPS